LSRLSSGGNVEVLGERGGPGDPCTDEQVERISALGRAVSDPIRVRMLGMMAAGREECCLPPGSWFPAGDAPAGLCVCEFEEHFGMGQSKVSYHMKKLKEAGLVREERRGRWNYYSIEEEAVRALLGDTADYLLQPAAEPGARGGVAGGC